LQVLKEQKERTLELEKRRRILANCTRETLGLRLVRASAWVNVDASPKRPPAALRSALEAPVISLRFGFI
jgi:hypothetical protein